MRFYNPLEVDIVGVFLTIEKLSISDKIFRFGILSETGINSKMVGVLKESAASFS